MYITCSYACLNICNLHMSKYGVLISIVDSLWLNSYCGAKVTKQLSVMINAHVASIKFAFHQFEPFVINNFFVIDHQCLSVVTEDNDTCWRPVWNQPIFLVHKDHMSILRQEQHDFQFVTHRLCNWILWHGIKVAELDQTISSHCFTFFYHLWSPGVFTNFPNSTSVSCRKKLCMLCQPEEWVA